MTTQVCPTCNAAVISGAKFCQSCGNEIPTANYCSNCGSIVQAGASFCSGCGQCINSAAPQPAPPSRHPIITTDSPSGVNNKNALIVSVFAVVAAMLIVFFVWAFRSRTASASGGDVYTAGLEYNVQGNQVATVWKNGSVHWRLTDGNNNARVNSIIVSGGDVYTAGYEGDAQRKRIATVWKNGSVYWRLTDGNNDALAHSIFISGDDVYTAGYEGKAKGNQVATVWKNGSVYWRLTDGNNLASANSIFISGDDVYAAGYEGKAKGNQVATVWKNGRVHWRLTDGNNLASAYSIFVSGGDVYAAGYENYDKDNSITIVWKNGSVHWRLTDRKTIATVQSIFVSDGDVYVAGWENNANDTGIAMVWKNGKVHWRLTDGNYSARVNSIFVGRTVAKETPAENVPSVSATEVAPVIDMQQSTSPDLQAKFNSLDKEFTAKYGKRIGGSPNPTPESIQDIYVQNPDSDWGEENYENEAVWVILADKAMSVEYQKNILRPVVGDGPGGMDYRKVIFIDTKGNRKEYFPVEIGDLFKEEWEAKWR